MLHTTEHIMFAWLFVCTLVRAAGATDAATLLRTRLGHAGTRADFESMINRYSNVTVVTQSHYRHMSAMSPVQQRSDYVLNMPGTGVALLDGYVFITANCRRRWRWWFRQQ
jgi:hypothetical protein